MGCGGSKEEPSKSQQSGGGGNADDEEEDYNPLTQEEVNARIVCSKEAETFKLGKSPITLRYAYLSQRGYYPEDLYKANQDAFKVVPKFGGDPSQIFFGVFDGHGACGDKVSQFTAEKVPELLEKHPKLKLNPATALEEAFVTVDRNLKEDATIDAELSGTTAVVVLLRKDAAKGTITAYTANAGDSRAVVATTGAGGKLGAPTAAGARARDSPRRDPPPRPAPHPAARPRRFARRARGPLGGPEARHAGRDEED